jgi:hypothetical protein
MRSSAKVLAAMAGMLAGGICLGAFLPLTYPFIEWVVLEPLPDVIVENASSTVYQTSGPILSIEGPMVVTLHVGEHVNPAPGYARDTIFGRVPVLATGYVNRDKAGEYQVYYFARNVLGGAWTQKIVQYRVVPK